MEGTMRPSHPLLALLLTLTIAGTTAAAESRPLKSAQSANERFYLRLRPGRAGQSTASRGCSAALFERRGKESRGRRVWTERLVNEVAPVHVQIRDDGRFLVTLDEFRRCGGAHALVIYDDHGNLLREFDLRELLRGDDWKHVKLERRAIEWLTDATFTFVNEPPQFVVKLKWGREIRIDLEKREIVRPAKEDKPGEIPPEILALLNQPTSAPCGSQPAPASQEEIARALAEMIKLAQSAGIELPMSRSAEQAAGGATSLPPPPSFPAPPATAPPSASRCPLPIRPIR